MGTQKQEESPEPVSVQSMSSLGSVSERRNPLLKNIQSIGQNLWQNLFKGDEALQNDPLTIQDCSSLVKSDEQAVAVQEQDNIPVA